MPFAIGYVTLEGFERAISPDYDIFATLLRESKTRMSGQVSMSTYLIVVSQPMDDEVHYCRIPVIKSDNWLNKPDELAEIEKAAEQAWGLVQEWLKEHGHHWHAAVCGISKDIEPIDGHADFLQRQENTFVRVDKNDSRT